ncbi:MAG: hypothetical protein IT269_07970 [Saprospiraceae bacterium]|nr:hypothetical protein [Saprospiraceae bacterium]
MIKLLNMLLIWLWCCSGITAASQADSLRLLLRIPVASAWAGTDHLGHVYTLRLGGALEKYNPSGQLLTRYANTRLGQPSSVDINNPLKITLWYSQFQTVVLLDRNLTELGVLRLADAGLWQPDAVATATDGNLWVHDAATFRLIKMKPDGEKLYESQPLNQLTPPILSVLQILETDDKVWLNDLSAGLARFDFFAQWEQTIVGLPVEGPVQMESSFIFYLKNDRLVIEPLTFGERREIPLPHPGKWLVCNRRLISISDNGVEVWGD